MPRILEQAMLLYFEGMHRTVRFAGHEKRDYRQPPDSRPLPYRQIEQPVPSRCEERLEIVCAQGFGGNQVRRKNLVHLGNADLPSFIE